MVTMEHCFIIISSPVFSLKPLWGKGHILITGHSQSIYCSSISVSIVSVTPWTVACQVPLSIEFTRQEYRSGLLFPSAGDLPDPVLTEESSLEEVEADLCKSKDQISNHGFQVAGRQYLIHNLEQRSDYGCWNI